jgi:hypothetical protein
MHLASKKAQAAASMLLVAVVVFGFGYLLRPAAATPMPRIRAWACPNDRQAIRISVEIDDANKHAFENCLRGKRGVWADLFIESRSVSELHINGADSATSVCLENVIRNAHFVGNSSAIEFGQIVIDFDSATPRD